MFADVPFVIDTGSETSCLHPSDAVRRFGISPGRLRDSQAWRAQAENVGVGGSATYFLVPCVYAFSHEDGHPQEIEAVLEIAQLTEFNRLMPSILGWDVLQHFAIRLDWSQRLVELT
jgi:hypothetical protein